MKVYFISLGCPRNLVDTESMMGQVNAENLPLTSSIQDADVIVVNTCGFLKKAREEAFLVLHQIEKEKKKEAKVIITGCMLSLHSHLLQSKFPNFSLLPPNEQDSLICKLLKKEGLLQKRRLVSTLPHFAYLKIAEGCRKQCSFCLIPKIKGKLHSKTASSILVEMKELLKQGVFEIILIAQDLADYGKDMGQQEGLVDLLKKIIEFKEEFWLRLLYINPEGITDPLLSLMASDPRICPYFDMPIQHIHDDLLHSMRRTTTKKQIINAIEAIRSKFSYCAIRTSILVGFPGEKEEHVLELADFLKTYQLDHVGFFSYSKEKGTPAYHFQNSCSSKCIEKRMGYLASIQKEIVQEKGKKQIGQIVTMIADSFHPESEYLVCGRTQLQCPDVDGYVIINDISPIKSFGKRYSVKITDAFDYDLVGKIIVNPIPSKIS